MVRDFKVTDKDKKKAEKDAVKASKKKDANRAADEKAALAKQNFGR